MLSNEFKHFAEAVDKVSSWLARKIREQKRKLLLLLSFAYIWHDRLVRPQNNFDGVEISYVANGDQGCVNEHDIRYSKQMYSMTCGIACMKMVASYFGQDLWDDAAIATQLWQKVDNFRGLLPHEIADYLQQALWPGYDCSYDLWSSIEDIQTTLDAQGLVIASIMWQGDGPHYVVVTDIDPVQETVSVINPAAPMYDQQGKSMVVAGKNPLPPHWQRPDSIQLQTFPTQKFQQKMEFTESSYATRWMDFPEVVGIRLFTDGITIHITPNENIGSDMDTEWLMR